ncbi:hypothetical protein ACFP81_00405 [Deinococcus lacus]|uniref:Uncharacterized protein n=1 Tax=Deinococcus lacus TaxID=392561 RepID=A0ABW1Y8Y6_9DEIO
MTFTEHITLLQVPEPCTLAALLESVDVTVTSQPGADPAGKPRLRLTLTGAEAEQVAAARQMILLACLRAGIPAVVV